MRRRLRDKGWTEILMISLIGWAMTAFLVVVVLILTGCWSWGGRGATCTPKPGVVSTGAGESGRACEVRK